MAGVFGISVFPLGSRQALFLSIFPWIFKLPLVLSNLATFSGSSVYLHVTCEFPCIMNLSIGSFLLPDFRSHMIS